MTREEYDKRITDTKQYQNGCLMALDVANLYIISLESRLVEVWEPMENEWCLFCNELKPHRTILDQFAEMTADGRFQSVCGTIWKHCYKFDGTLPEHLKGNLK